MTSPTPPPSSTNGDARLAGPPAVSKKQLRKLAKAQFLAERKAERRAAVDDDDAPQSRRQRKRRNQRNCHRGQDAGTPDEDPDVEYVACTSPSCSGGEGGLQNRCQLRIVAPYLHRFQSFVKARWCGRSLGDVFFEEFEGLPAKYCRAAISMGLIRINGQAKQSEYTLRNGDFLEHVMHRHEPPIHVESSAGSSSVVHYDTEEVVVVNKPSSLPVHPSGAYRHNSMTFLLQRECNLPELFPVHRLDRLTSGLLMFSKSAVKARALCEEIASGQVQKHYVARVSGEFPVVTSRSDDRDQKEAFTQVRDDALVQMSTSMLGAEEYWRMSAPMACVSPLDHVQGVSSETGSKSAETLFRRLSFNGSHSIVECLPVTGRTHQIRVHLKHLGFPIVNDPLYGPREPAVSMSEGESEAIGSSVVGGEKGKTPAPQCSVDADAGEAEREVADAIDKEEARRCASICPACRDGDAAVFSSTHLTCFAIWLHSYKYESSSWSFQVPLPAWAQMK